MKVLRVTQIILTLLLSLVLAAQAELDSRIIGDWVSSSGAKIHIYYPSENESLVYMEINGGSPIQGRLEYGDMDSLIVTYRSGGSKMRANFNPMTHVITVWEGNREYSTWKKAR